MKQRNKKAFTLLEILIVLVIAVPIIALTMVALSHTLNLYSESRKENELIGGASSMIATIDAMTDICGDVEIVNDVLVVERNGIQTGFNPSDYGISATFSVDDSEKIIYITIGGELHCITYNDQISSGS